MLDPQTKALIDLVIKMGIPPTETLTPLRRSETTTTRCCSLSWACSRPKRPRKLTSGNNRARSVITPST